MIQELELWDTWGDIVSQKGSFDSAKRVDFYSLHSSHLRARNNLTQKPDIVYAIPAYNEVENLPKALASVDSSLKMVNTDLVVRTVVVDNCSEDATSEVAQEYGVDVIKEPKKGLGNARQACLDHALRLDARILMFSDADSVIPSLFIRQHAHALVSENKVYSRGSLLFLPDNLHFRNVSRIARTLLYSFVANNIHYLFNKAGIWTAIGSGAYLVDEAKKIGGYVKSKMRGVDSTLMHSILKNTNGGLNINNRLCVINSSRRLDAEGIIRHGLWRLKNDIKGIINGTPDTDMSYLNYR